MYVSWEKLIIQYAPYYFDGGSGAFAGPDGKEEELEAKYRNEDKDGPGRLDGDRQGGPSQVCSLCLQLGLEDLDDVAEADDVESDDGDDRDGEEEDGGATWNLSGI